MQLVLILTISMLMTGTFTIYDFDKNSDLANWYIVDDRVMGGVSNGTFNINDDGNAVFNGKVSLENNGGFSSVRYDSPLLKVDQYSTIAFRVRGDGKQYQFRIKSNARDRHSYITYFETSTKWETIEIKLSDLYASFRGRKLNMPDYDGKIINELAFLFGNKKAESFQLEIDWITLR